VLSVKRISKKVPDSWIFVAAMYVSTAPIPIPSGEDTGDTNDRIDLQDSVVGRIIEVGGAILDD
jgi:hypothetical protein